MWLRVCRADAHALTRMSQNLSERARESGREFRKRVYGIKPHSIKQYRNEWKYRCRPDRLAVLGNRLSALLRPDPNGGSGGKYEIHSLYFDDLHDTCMQENDAGISARFKYRIRYYGSRCDSLKLERKEKLNGRCHKDSCPISAGEYQAIVSGNAAVLFWQTDKPLLKRFCLDCMAHGFAPKVIIDYEREAFIEEVTNIRITLDKNISASAEPHLFLNGGYIRYPVQPGDEQILEVKFDGILPGYLRHAITDPSFVQTSFSKYYLGRKTLQNMGRPTL